MNHPITAPASAGSISSARRSRSPSIAGADSGGGINTLACLETSSALHGFGAAAAENLWSIDR